MTRCRLIMHFHGRASATTPRVSTLFSTAANGSLVHYRSTWQIGLIKLQIPHISIHPSCSEITCRYKTLEYSTLHTGGFLRICTSRGRVYWLAQNEHEHTTPDWKLHFSIHLDDIARAWDVVACAFLQAHCEMGMKVVLLRDRDEWQATQRGREITVYIFHVR